MDCLDFRSLGSRSEALGDQTKGPPISDCRLASVSRRITYGYSLDDHIVIVAHTAYVPTDALEADSSG